MEIVISTYIGKNHYRANLHADDNRGSHHEMEVEGEYEGSSNAGELIAVIEALRRINRPGRVRILSESDYLVSCINNGWASRWQQSMWLNAKMKPVRNKELWQQLTTLLSVHRYIVEKRS